MESKERILKSTREKYQITYQGKLIRITDFFNRNLKSKKGMK
jgi:hypothetical protein